VSYAALDMSERVLWAKMWWTKWYFLEEKDEE
jgi:hypothetical protein